MPYVTGAFILCGVLSFMLPRTAVADEFSAPASRSLRCLISVSGPRLVVARIVSRAPPPVLADGLNEPERPAWIGGATRKT